MQIPWWAKLSAKLLLSRLPFRYAIWQGLGLFRHGRMDNSQYAISVFHSHVSKAGYKHGLTGKTILELGPGDSIATAIIAAAYGARAIIVDTGRYVRENIGPYVELVNALPRNGMPYLDVSRCRNTNEILRLCNAEYLTEGLHSLRQLDSESIDLIFSQAVLEHIRKRDFLATMRECHRILRPNGVCSHQIDLRDHLGGALNNLRFSERIWESEFFSKSGFYTNRIQYGQMMNFFAQAGFMAQVADVQRWDRLPTSRNHLDREYIRIPDEELCISRFDVLLRPR